MAVTPLWCNTDGMRRFQMMLDEELDDALAARAEQEGVSKAELLRAFARDRLLLRAVGPDDPFWDFLAGAEERPDLVQDHLTGRISENINEALYGSSDNP